MDWVGGGSEGYGVLDGVGDVEGLSGVDGGVVVMGSGCIG